MLNGNFEEVVMNFSLLVHYNRHPNDKGQGIRKKSKRGQRLKYPGAFSQIKIITHNEKCDRKNYNIL